jgi:hypothetical protein
VHLLVKSIVTTLTMLPLLPTRDLYLQPMPNEDKSGIRLAKNEFKKCVTRQVCIAVML